MNLFVYSVYWREKSEPGSPYENMEFKTLQEALDFLREILDKGWWGNIVTVECPAGKK